MVVLRGVLKAMNKKLFDIKDNGELSMEFSDDMLIERGALRKIEAAPEGIFLPMHYIDDFIPYFQYNIGSKVSLRNYLLQKHSAAEILRLFSTILQAESYFERQQLDKSFLALDIDCIYAENDGSGFSIMTIPALDSGIKFKPLRLFIKELLVNILYIPEESLEFVGQMIAYMNENKVIHPAEFQTFIARFQTLDYQWQPTPAEEQPSVSVQSEWVQTAVEEKSEEETQAAVSEKTEALDKNEETEANIEAENEETEAAEEVAEAIFDDDDYRLMEEYLSGDDDDDDNDAFSQDKTEDADAELPEPVEIENDVPITEPDEKPEQKINHVMDEDVDPVQMVKELSELLKNAPFVEAVADSVAVKAPEMIKDVIEQQPKAQMAKPLPIEVLPQAVTIAKESKEVVANPKDGFEALKKVVKGAVADKAAPEIRKDNDIMAKDTQPAMDLKEARKQETVKRIYLLRRKTDETYDLTKEKITIGKARSLVDICIPDNPAVSREHALLIKSDGRYSISDSHSTNHTYVNGILVRPGMFKDLYNGDKIYLGNEEMVFLVK